MVTRLTVPKAPWSAAARRRLGFQVDAGLPTKGMALVRRAVGMNIETARRRRAAALQGAPRFGPTARAARRKHSPARQL
jgi:hypothetical protein